MRRSGHLLAQVVQLVAERLQVIGRGPGLELLLQPIRVLACRLEVLLESSEDPIACRDLALEDVADLRTYLPHLHLALTKRGELRGCCDLHCLLLSTQLLFGAGELLVVGTNFRHDCLVSSDLVAEVEVGHGHADPPFQGRAMQAPCLRSAAPKREWQTASEP